MFLCTKSLCAFLQSESCAHLSPLPAVQTAAAATDASLDPGRRAKWVGATGRRWRRKRGGSQGLDTFCTLRRELSTPDWSNMLILI